VIGKTVVNKTNMIRISLAIDYRTP